MSNRRIPNCCGSENGDLRYGMDLCTDIEVMVELWVCWTCGVITVVDVVQIDSTDGPTALPTG